MKLSRFIYLLSRPVFTYLTYYYYISDATRRTQTNWAQIINRHQYWTKAMWQYHNQLNAFIEISGWKECPKHCMDENPEIYTDDYCGMLMVELDKMLDDENLAALSQKE